MRLLISNNNLYTVMTTWTKEKVDIKVETMVWPNFFLMKVFFALKGSILFYYYFLSLQLDVVPCGGRKSLPALIYSADYILLLVL